MTQREELIQKTRDTDDLLPEGRGEETQNSRETRREIAQHVRGVAPR